jgi:hypothetical protein
MEDFNPESETLSRAASLLLATNDKIAQSLCVRTLAKEVEEPAKWAKAYSPVRKGWVE